MANHLLAFANWIWIEDYFCDRCERDRDHYPIIATLKNALDDNAPTSTPEQWVFDEQRQEPICTAYVAPADIVTPLSMESSTRYDHTADMFGSNVQL